VTKLRGRTTQAARGAQIVAAFLTAAALTTTAARAQEFVPTDPPEHPRLQYSEAGISLNDRCPVRQAKLNPAFRPVYINRKPVSFCCMSCAGVFVQEPERYMNALKLEPPSVLPKGKKPILDSSLRYRIGFEVYYFANRAEMDLFKKDPLRYCGTLTDPITMARFHAHVKSPKVVYAERTYYFAADSCLTLFLANPEQHKDRRNGMN
jgi:YHS domain-containing protein